MNDFNADLNRILYSATESDVANLLSQMADPDGPEVLPNSHHRLVTADALQEQNREPEANLLHSPHHIYLRNGKVYHAKGGPQSYGHHTASITPVERFQRGYRDAALWSSLTDDGLPMDEHHTEGDLHPTTRKEMDADAAHFYHSYQHLLNGNRFMEDAGHDFWLTRNGHGVGFRDRDETDYTDDEGNDTRHLLEDAADKAGEYDLSSDAGDDEEAEDDTRGTIYGTGHSSKEWGQPAGIQNG